MRAHRVSTAHLQAAYPFLSEGGLGGDGVYAGREVLGGAFCYDPWVLYRRGLLTSPNMLVAGQVGRGKSAFVKTWLWRLQVFGRRAGIIDPKGEYGPLARACGTDPIRIGPGLGVRVNPLAPGPGHRDPAEVARRRLSLLTSLAAASLRRPLTPRSRPPASSPSPPPPPPTATSWCSATSSRHCCGPKPMRPRGSRPTRPTSPPPDGRSPWSCAGW